MKHRWQKSTPPDPAIIESLRSSLGIHPVLCRLLAQRNITSFEEARDFFRPSLKMLHDPFLMKDMNKAVERINKAVKEQEKILIYGDYDVDGTTAVSLLSSFLLPHYKNIDTYIPDRYKEGYGVSKAGIDYAASNKMSLIIALDCGIKANEKVEYANSLGIDFIICDHHRPGKEIPKAVAVLDPKREDCEYPYDELSGCGVGFKLVQALCRDWKLPDSEWMPLLDLLAVSIGSDIVPITGENRILAYFGLKKINEDPRPGFAFLKEMVGKTDCELSITDVVFIIGPRINAAGRIAHGKLAVDLLSGSDHDQIEKDSFTINQHNSERRELDKNITAAALTMIEEMQEQERKSTVLFDQTWHKGVIGIVASRLIESYYRPTVVFTESNGKLAGSARSVKGFDVYKALDECSDILEQFGGHMYAAGMTLRKERFNDFKNRFEEIVSKTITREQLTPVIEIDAELELHETGGNFHKILKQFAPFGPQNMNPVFQTNNLFDSGYSKVVGQDRSHLKADLIDKRTGIRISGIAFGMAEKYPLLTSQQPISVVYHLEENIFNGHTSLQMRIKDIKLSSEVEMEN